MTGEQEGRRVNARLSAASACVNARPALKEENTNLAQVPEMCKFPPEAPFISNLRTFSPTRDKHSQDQIVDPSQSQCGVETITPKEDVKTTGVCVCVTEAEPRRVLTQRTFQCEGH